jgi:hypothetical protein
MAYKRFFDHSQELPVDFLAGRCETNDRYEKNEKT